MTTILDKKPASQEGRENLTQVADPKRMEGAVRVPVLRQVWGSGKLSQALNQEPVNGPGKKIQMVVCW